MNCHCGLPMKAKGLCSKHYLADYRTRKANGVITKLALAELKIYSHKGFGKDTCGVDDCQHTIKAKGLCNRHYLQLRRAITK